VHLNDALIAPGFESVVFRLREATLADLSTLQALIARSARELSAGLYTPEQVEGALLGAFGVDTQLIRDGTYYVVEAAGNIVACGGWSFRRTPFGSDDGRERDVTELVPATDHARIRAFFVEPAYARRGLGTLLLERCESEAAARGFARCEMTATLPGERLYAARGYVPTSRVSYALRPDLHIEFVLMRKDLPSRV
jgi:GNAT superfamily N-acetyltransferase